MPASDASDRPSLPVRLRLIPRHSIAKAAAAGVLSAFALLGSEWLFFVTKPSALSEEGFLGQLEALLAAPFPLMVLGALWCGAFEWAALRAGRLAWALRCAGVAFPSLCLGATGFLLADNFTYTLLGFNVLNAPFPMPYGYAVGLVATTAAAGTWVWRKVHSPGPAAMAVAWVPGAAALMALSAAFVVVSGSADGPARASTHVQAQRRPNILIIGGDGINARNMSAYGYARDTTPFTSKWIADALTARHAFSNCFQTTGAIGALLTGKLPSTTRVMFAPDIYRDRHAEEHFAGVLRGLGYTSGDFGVKHYADAFGLNIRDGFDVAIGGRREYFGRTSGWALVQPWRSSPAYRFTGEVIERLGTRAGHAFGIMRSGNLITLVTRPETAVKDRERRRELIEFMSTAPEPFFAHAHFMVTHGTQFDVRPEYRAFSAGLKSEPWHPDFYDDAIRDFDAQFEEVVLALREMGKLERTIVVLYSDHGFRHNSYERVPLAFRFPGGEPRGRRSGNAQLVDVAPTLLDYLGAPIPSWMEGRSLLPEEEDRMRHVFIARKIKPQPRFKALWSLSLSVCQRHYVLRLPGGQLKVTEAPDYPEPCDPRRLPDPQQARRMLVQHLSERGWDVSALHRPGG